MRAHDAATPAVSVIMPVHNALPHLDEAIESVLAQTFEDFEFVILDDASTDGSTERLRDWAARDPRIRLIEVEKNLGPALSSERVARAARAPIVARTDADDICYPRRLEEQLAVLQRHPDVGVVGGLCEIIDTNGRKIREPERWRLARRSVFAPFGNGPMMYRRALFEQVGGYRIECEFWEDQDLIIRLAAATKILVIPHAIYQVRQSRTSTRFVSNQDRLEHAVDLMYRSCALLERGESYDNLLKSSADADGKLDPRVFISLGSVVLWAGGRPRLFRRLLSRGELSFDFRTASALVWTAWASLDPGTLRQFLMFLLRARNRFASARLRTDKPIRWQPLQQAEPLDQPAAAPARPRSAA
jgi:glycosyltransferase involved in cell wall biosynthesis